MNKHVHGNLAGLRNSQIKRIENLYNLKSSPAYIISPDAARELVQISHDIRRQVGLLVDRNGKIVYVIAGDPHGIMIPVTPDHMAIPGRLKGLRCVHTHLKDEPLTKDDVTDLALLRLDYITAICLTPDGRPGPVYSGHILPDETKEPYQVMPGATISDLNIDCLARIMALEEELSRKNALHKPATGRENAFLINAVTQNPQEAHASMEELKELCRTSRITVTGTAIQHRKQIDPKFVVGKGKLSSLVITAIQNHAT
ncbi:MAG: GTPase HflX, partial [Desulfobacteraceae bacterium]|nr:GTPase HflX [Desulfobacteraceae bacterium]